MTRPQTRMSAEDRRDQVLDAALIEFAQGGLAGTSTEAIASRVGISQPYLFRLFSTKKELFVATAQRCFDNIAATFALAAGGLAGEAAIAAMGNSYKTLLADRNNLLAQLQMYAACDDPEIRDCVRAGFKRLYSQVESASGAPAPVIVTFFAAGMLCNLATALQLDAVEEPWAQALRTVDLCFQPS
ncbi:MAG: TetR/AcrR family transcriptional regulator [Acidothermaceae bacterium]